MLASAFIGKYVIVIRVSWAHVHREGTGSAKEFNEGRDMLRSIL